MMVTEQDNWSGLSPEEKKKELYLRQKRILDDFLERGAITQAQYDKSFGDLTEKMGMGDYKTNKPRECPIRPHLSPKQLMESD